MHTGLSHGHVRNPFRKTRIRERLLPADHKPLNDFNFSSERILLSTKSKLWRSSCCSFRLDVMRKVNTIWCLYLLLVSLFLANAGQPVPCVSSVPLSWSITQNCTLNTADVQTTGSSNVAELSLEGAVAGELSTVLLLGPPLSGVLSAHHHPWSCSLSSQLPSVL